ncbi:MAG: TRAP transporter fused permease subunit [Geminicoccaceae bacterium]|nr:TRAP transporter fused permease subunit [Geminicoccaceae bacterium]
MATTVEERIDAEADERRHEFAVGGPPLLKRLVFWFAVAFALFHIWANTLGTMPELNFAALHFAGFGLLCALTMPAFKGAPFWLDVAVGLAAVACGIYVIFAFDWIYARRGVGFIWSDWLFSILAILVIFELARRVAGLFIPLMTAVFLSYMTWLGPLVPGVFKFPGLTWETALFRSYIEVAGMFGPIAYISATFVFMFIIFGAFLLRSGAGDFVIDLARAMAGRMVGGPGIVAVLGSALTGTVSGSAVANTVSTGTITIPLMKKAGFPAKFAAGVEASASTGGQLMPPIMGAGAFVMATYTQISYLTIVAVSVLPAILFFFSVAVWVRIEAKKQRIGGADDDAPTVKETLAKGGISFLLPIGVLIGMLMTGYTPTYAAAFSILAVVAASWLTPNRMGPRAICEALALGTRNMISTAILLISVGIVVMTVGTTGIGNTLSLMLADIAGGNLFIALVLVALVSLVLGMGLPVTAAYIVLATLSAPAIKDMILVDFVVDEIAGGTLSEQAKAIFMLADPNAVTKLAAPMSHADALALYALVPPDFSSMLFEQALNPATITTALLSAHMIIFWLSQDSNVTPPVCLTAFAAAAIAKTSPMATGLTAWRISKGLYIVPILFAYTPILAGDWLVALRISCFAALGIYAIAAGFEGHAERPIPFWLRPIVFGLGLALVWPTGPWWNSVCTLALIATFFVMNRMPAPQARPDTG